MHNDLLTWCQYDVTRGIVLSAILHSGETSPWRAAWVCTLSQADNTQHSPTTLPYTSYIVKIAEKYIKNFMIICHDELKSMISHMGYKIYDIWEHHYNGF